MTATWGSTIVATFQEGRFASGGSGAAAAGFATSLNGGGTWITGVLPGVTTSSTPAGVYPRTVNMTVAYDAKHAQWLITNNVSSFTGVHWYYTALLVSRSSDGVHWGTPVTAVIGPNPPSIRPDKGWIACDNTPTSPHYGRCYVTYISQALNRRFQMVHSDDGGQTWTAPVGTASNAVGYDPIPIVRADGTVFVVGTANLLTQVVAFRSTDGGLSWTDPVLVSNIQLHTLPASLRTRSKPSVAMDAAGVLYVAWYDCRFRSTCSSNDIVVSHSSGGVTWTAPKRVAVDATTSGIDHFVAGLGVKPGTSGATARLDLVFYELRAASCNASTCAIDAVTTHSTNAGATWSAPVRLDSTPMRTSMLPNTTIGLMLADYHTVAYSAGVPWAAVVMATAKTATFHEAIYGARLS